MKMNSVFLAFLSGMVLSGICFAKDPKGAYWGLDLRTDSNATTYIKKASGDSWYAYREQARKGELVYIVDDGVPGQPPSRQVKSLDLPAKEANVPAKVKDDLAKWVVKGDKAKIIFKGGNGKPSEFDLEFTKGNAKELKAGKRVELQLTSDAVKQMLENGKAQAVGILRQLMLSVGGLDEQLFQNGMFQMNYSSEAEVLATKHPRGRVMIEGDKLKLFEMPALVKARITVTAGPSLRAKK